MRFTTWLCFASTSLKVTFLCLKFSSTWMVYVLFLWHVSQNYIFSTVSLTGTDINVSLATDVHYCKFSENGPFQLFLNVKFPLFVSQNHNSVGVEHLDPSCPVTCLLLCGTKEWKLYSGKKRAD